MWRAVEIKQAVTASAVMSNAERNILIGAPSLPVLQFFD